MPTSTLRPLGLALLAALSLTALARAQGYASEVADVQPGASGSTGPNAVPGIAVVGPYVVAPLVDATHGKEMHRLDGAGHAAPLVLDVQPGTGDGAAWWQPAISLFPTTRLGDRALFVGDDGITGREIWVTDGTGAGTSLVADLTPGGDSSGFQQAVPLQGRAFLEMDDCCSGLRHLWTTDGTSAGTYEIPMASGTYFHSVLGTFDHWAIASGYDDALHPLLGRSDGTPGAVEPISTTVGVDPSSWTLKNGAQYRNLYVFGGSDGSTGTEVWQTGGTSGTTQQVADIATGSASSSPRSFTYHLGLLYFTATDPVHGRELYRYLPATLAHGPLVERLTDLDGGSGDGVWGILGSLGGKLLFVGNDGTTGWELWSTDGPAGTETRLSDFYPGSGQGTSTGGVADDTSLPDFAIVGDHAYVEAISPLPGGSIRGQLYVTDGTVAGTLPVFATSAAALQPVAAGDRLYFTDDPDGVGHGGEPWSLDMFDQRGTVICSAPHVPVPDADAGGVADSIHVQADQQILDLEVSVNVEHTSVSDLQVILTGPNDVSVLLHDGATSCAGTDMQLTFSDRASTPVGSGCTAAEPAWPRFSSWQPTKPLAPLGGQSTQGTWTLKVVDGAAGNAGVLHDWCVRFRTAVVSGDAFESGTLGGWSAAASGG